MHKIIVTDEIFMGLTFDFVIFHLHFDITHNTLIEYLYCQQYTEIESSREQITQILLC